MTEIVLKNIFKSYDQTEVIHGVDLKVESGKFLVLVGPSGCGKSTLLRIIAGLERITSGEILIEGNEVSNIPASERGLAMVFQSYALYPHMSVYKNMAFSLENLKIDKKTIEDKVNNPLFISMKKKTDIEKLPLLYRFILHKESLLDKSINMLELKILFITPVPFVKVKNLLV